MAFRNNALSLIVLLAIPCAAHADEWRFCIGADKVGDNMRAPLMITKIFRSDLVPGYEQQIAAYVVRHLTITGEVDVSCTDPYATEHDALTKQIDWLDMMTNGDVAMEVVSAEWEPTYPAAPEPARQVADADADAPASHASATNAPPQAAQGARETAAQQTAASAEAQRQATRLQEEQAEQRRQHYERQRVAAQQGGAVTDDSSSGGGGGKPLRFVMMMPMRPQVGDTHNPTCYSNVITRPGPPGWGGPGFLPSSSAAQADQTVQSLKAAFIAKCRAASGREMLSDGNFRFEWNQLESVGSGLDSIGARFPGDVTVQMD